MALSFVASKEFKCQSQRNRGKKNEPACDKTKNVAMRPAKTQISLGIRPV